MSIGDEEDMVRYLQTLLIFLSGLSPLAFHFPKLSTRQWGYLTHSWDPLPLACSGRGKWVFEQVEFEDTIEVIRIHQSKKNRQ
jgi:hypothetical protein